MTAPPLLGPLDALPARPARVIVAGTSGSGKTAVAARIARTLGLRHVEIDVLYHGPGWTPRSSFAAEVAELAASEAWVVEWQYDQARPQLADRADLAVWLDFSRARVVWQVTSRTVRRRVRRQVLWNGNVEPPLHRVFVDPEHIIRWAWSSHARTVQRVTDLHRSHPHLPVVRLADWRSVERWITGPLAGWQ